jgi:alkanesulfonate monooxygenase SsuD/methylene tetrahydromethanopterin reductase-like flavin-dependent oxidoreductase (luciferase family)
VGLQQPGTAVAIFAFCSEDEETVRRAQLMMDFRLLHIGDDTSMPSYETASRYEYSPAQQKQIEFNRGRMIIGDPSQVKKQLQKLADECGTDELIISTFADKAEDRLESYRLIKKMFV